MTESEPRSRLGPWLAVAGSIVAAAAVAAALFVLGPPSAQREARMDRKRVMDLQRIVDRVGNYATNHDTMPESLSVLSRTQGHGFVDPETGAPYEYELIGDRRFRVCADFATDSQQDPAGLPYPADGSWNHGRGRHCFDRKAGD